MGNIFNKKPEFNDLELLNARAQNARAVDMEVLANQKLGKFYFDITSNTFKYWNGSKWVAGSEGALTPIGTIDANSSSSSGAVRRNVPSGLTGDLVSKGDAWFVATRGDYTFVDADGNPTTQKLNPSDFLFCSYSDPQGLTNARWSLVKSGEDILICIWEYDSSAPNVQTKEFVNLLKSNNCVYNLYKSIEVTDGAITTETLRDELGEVEFIKITDSTDPSAVVETYKIKVDFDRPLVAGEKYILIAMTI